VNEQDAESELVGELRELLGLDDVQLDDPDLLELADIEIEQAYGRTIGRSRQTVLVSTPRSQNRRILVLAACLAVLFGFSISHIARHSPTPTIPLTTDTTMARAIQLAASYQPARHGPVHFVELESITTSRTLDRHGSPTYRYGYSRSSSWVTSRGGGRLDLRIFESQDNFIDNIDFDKLKVLEKLSENIPDSTFSPELIDKLPRETEDLKSALIALSGGPDCGVTIPETNCLANAVIQLYAYYVIPADLAASLWNVMAMDSTIEAHADVMDRLGRQAFSVTIMEPSGSDIPTTLTLYISSDTGRLIGTEQRVGDGSSSLVGAQYWLDSGFVERVGQYPDTHPS